MADDTSAKLIDAYEIVLRHLQGVLAEQITDRVRTQELLQSVRASLANVRKAADQPKSEKPE